MLPWQRTTEGFFKQNSYGAVITERDDEQGNIATAELVHRVPVRAMAPSVSGALQFPPHLTLRKQTYQLQLICLSPSGLEYNGVSCPQPAASATLIAEQ
jgi:hypothetical protein